MHVSRGPPYTSDIHAQTNCPHSSHGMTGLIWHSMDTAVSIQNKQNTYKWINVSLCFTAVDITLLWAHIARVQLSRDLWYVHRCHLHQQPQMAALAITPGSCVNKVLWAQNPSLVKTTSILNINDNDRIMWQSCTCHDSWAVMTCAWLSHDWIVRINFRAKFFFARFQLRAHKVLVKWSPGHSLTPKLLQFTPGKYDPSLLTQ